MRASTRYQKDLKTVLSRFFPGETVVEYFIPKNARDQFGREVGVYLPRLDVAVGPFNETDGDAHERIKNEYFEKAPQFLRNITNGLSQNKNPRCALGIEVVYSGTSKHILGDMLNSGTIGLYGLVLVAEDMYSKVARIQEYVRVVKGMRKLPGEFCSNVRVLKADDFLNGLRNISIPNQRTL